MTDKSKANNLVMVDFAHRDPRSFKAHLLGAGDGRQRLYEKMLASKGGNDLAALHDKFAAQVWDEQQANDTGNEAAPAVGHGKLLLRVVVPVVGLLLGVMLYQVFVA